VRKLSKIRIGPYDWKVTYFGKDEYMKRECFGRTDELAMELEICDAFTNQSTANTMLHEIFHALWFAHNMKSKEGEEETSVAALATGMTQVFKDNPDLIKWLQEMVK